MEIGNESPVNKRIKTKKLISIVKQLLIRERSIFPIKTLMTIFVMLTMSHGEKIDAE